jgi:CubicO group peptidase (beta-lactamase class C family)
MSLPRLFTAQFLITAPLLINPAFAADPAAAVDPVRLARIDEAVKAALEKKELPGAVVLVVQRDRVIFRKAFGHRATQPAAVNMTADTLFDLASLTKPVATATSIMLLVEQGELSLSDRVAKYWPAFGAKGKDKITVEQLLLHTSGLIADNNVADYHDGKAKALERIADLTPTSEPGSRFAYSDVGYIVLGELVERIAGVPLNSFAKKYIFDPLGMKETTFLPDEKLTERAAPTEQRDGHWMKGEVHDPRAYALGGIAGHAGLFSTADDLAIFVRMLLQGGGLDGKRILCPLTVRQMTTPREVPGGLRALGWDVQTAFSTNRGDLFPRGESFGHTGFTGTSLWIDPSSATAVIFLSNRVHPDGKGNVTKLRAQVATLAAAAMFDFPSAANEPDCHGPVPGDISCVPILGGPFHRLTQTHPHCRPSKSRCSNQL